MTANPALALACWSGRAVRSSQAVGVPLTEKSLAHAGVTVTDIPLVVVTSSGSTRAKEPTRVPAGLASATASVPGSAANTGASASSVMDKLCEN